MVKGQQVGVASQSDTRVQLIHAALVLFDSNGYPRTSVEDIVAKAKVTKGAFYHHFESKEEVLEIIHNVYVESQIELCTRIMSDGGNPREQLRELARATITNLNQYRAHVSVYMQDRRFLTGQRKKNVLEKRSEIDKLFNSIIEDGVRGGFFRSDVSPKLITFGIIGMYAWVINWWKPSGSLSLQQIADQYVDVLLDGLNKK
jgi:TetR/AcrR family transcriptional regulator, cholesterol catabolism regulator